MDKKKVTKLLQEATICFLDYDRNKCKDTMQMGLEKLDEAQEELQQPTLEDYIESLPCLTFESDGYGEDYLKVTSNDWAYIPTLYKFEGKWLVDWVEGEDHDSGKVIEGATPIEAARNAYNWCIEKGFIEDIFNNE